MTERPILFSAPMVIALLQKKKRMTRRVVKPLRGWEKHHTVCNPDMAHDPWAVWWHYPETDRVGHIAECPYGKPGDRLWVRESYIEGFPTGEPGRWSVLRPTEFDGHGKAFYRADGEDPIDGPQRSWKPSLFMPRWASRLTLEITEVKVERLQAISEEDAQAEGVTEPEPAHGSWCDPTRGREGHWSYRKAFSTLWASIHGPKSGASWSDNPFVWVISFEVLK